MDGFVGQSPETCTSDGTEQVVRESLPFLLGLVSAVLLVTYVPALTLTLPDLVFDQPPGR